MGMFDNIRCKYPLPGGLPWANDMVFQTKDTPAQWMENYEIREDGSLWHEDYQLEDKSDAAKWWRLENPGKEAPEGIDRFCGCMSRVNRMWVSKKLTGEIVFYGIPHKDLPIPATRDVDWVEWSAYFVDGKLKEINLVELKRKAAK